MKSNYICIFLTFLCSFTYAQEPAIETVGNGQTPTLVSNYNDWINEGILNFSGDALVQNINPSSRPNSSGGCNVYFTSVPGTYFQISKFTNQLIPPDFINFAFDLFGYDTTNLNELNLTVSTDSGMTWNQLNYIRLLGNLTQLTPWDHFSAGLSYSSFDLNKLMFRFTQSTSTKTFRIDDFYISYGYLLPIKFESFSILTNANDNALIWRAISNNSGDSFIVERSKNGNEYLTINHQRTKGLGDFQYKYIDREKCYGKTFYRIKALNVDGKNSYSKIIAISDNVKNAQLLQASYPVPSSNFINVKLNILIAGNIHFKIIDSKGSVKINEAANLSSGINIYKLNIQSLQSGNYYLSIEDDKNIQTQKILILK